MRTDSYRPLAYRRNDNGKYVEMPTECIHCDEIASAKHLIWDCDGFEGERTEAYYTAWYIFARNNILWHVKKSIRDHDTAKKKLVHKLQPLFMKTKGIEHCPNLVLQPWSDKSIVTRMKLGINFMDALAANKSYKKDEEMNVIINQRYEKLKEGNHASDLILKLCSKEYLELLQTDKYVSLIHTPSEIDL